MRTTTTGIVIVTLLYGCVEGYDQNEVIAEVDLKEIADLIVHDELSEYEFNDLQLSDDEKLDLILEVGILRGADPDELEQELLNDNELLRGACSQNLEKANLSDDTYSYTHYQDTWCDGDGTDTDWLYEFSPNWADDPDNMRWWADDWWIRQVFSAPKPSYNGLLLGSSLCTSPVRLCLGTNGVTTAGGASAVANNLFISH